LSQIINNPSSIIHHQFDGGDSAGPGVGLWLSDGHSDSPIMLPIYHTSPKPPVKRNARKSPRHCEQRSDAAISQATNHGTAEDAGDAEDTHSRYGQRDTRHALATTKDTKNHEDKLFRERELELLAVAEDRHRSTRIHTDFSSQRAQGTRRMGQMPNGDCQIAGPRVQPSWILRLQGSVRRNRKLCAKTASRRYGGSHHRSDGAPNWETAQ
jgi:hypothetical protein